MSRKKLGNGWIRDTSEEDGSIVYRWYEKPEEGIIASIVQSRDFPNETELRASGKKFDSFFSRGSKSIMLSRSDKEMIKSIEMLIRRKLD